MPIPTYTEAVDINLDGRNKLARFLAANLNDEYLRDVFSGWSDDVIYNQSFNGEALFILPKKMSKNGEDIALRFNNDEIESVTKRDYDHYDEAI